MSIFGKDHYIKFCITTFSSKNAEVRSVQVSKITLKIMIILIMSCVSCMCTCAVFMSTF